MATHAYIPEEDEAVIVRRFLREFGRKLQQRGEIPADVPEAEINAEVEQWVPDALRALRKSPIYPHLRGESSEHLEAHIRRFLQDYLA